MSEWDYFEAFEVIDVEGLPEDGESDQEFRDRLIEALQDGGVDLETTDMDDEELMDLPGHTLIVWFHDRFGSMSVYAIPNNEITDDMREALEQMPTVFSDRSDFDGVNEDLVGALQWMATLDTEELSANDFYGKFVEPWCAGGDPAVIPTKSDIESAYGSWLSYCIYTRNEEGDDVLVEDGLDRRFTSMWLFRRAEE